MAKEECANYLAVVFRSFIRNLIKIQNKDIEYIDKMQSEYVLRGAILMRSIKIKYECPDCHAHGHIEFDRCWEFASKLIIYIKNKSFFPDGITQNERYILSKENEVLEMIDELSIDHLLFECQKCFYVNKQSLIVDSINSNMHKVNNAGKLYVI
jgi:hypothetical protein